MNREELWLIRQVVRGRSIELLGVIAKKNAGRFTALERTRKFSLVKIAHLSVIPVIAPYCNILAVDQLGYNVLHRAYAAKDDHLIEYLSKIGPSSKTLAEHRDFFGNTAEDYSRSGGKATPLQRSILGFVHGRKFTLPIELNADTFSVEFVERQIIPSMSPHKTSFLRSMKFIEEMGYYVAQNDDSLFGFTQHHLAFLRNDEEFIREFCSWNSTLCDHSGVPPLFYITPANFHSILKVIPASRITVLFRVDGYPSNISLLHYAAEMLNINLRDHLTRIVSQHGADSRYFHQVDCKQAERYKTLKLTEHM